MIVRRMRLLIGLIGLAAAVVAVYVFVSVRPLTVTAVTPESDVAVRVFGLGTVEARVVSQVGFAVGGTLTELTADHGDPVTKGTVLARLHSTEQEAKLARAEAGVLQADVSVKKAEANVQRARAVLAQRQEANRRQQALITRNVVSQQTAEEAKRDEDVAAAELAVASSEIEVAGAQVADARAALAYEKALLDDHVLTAPYDAVIVQRHKEAGSVIKAGDSIYTLMAPETVWALAYVDEERAGAIEEGQEAEVRLRSRPQDTFQARVVRIGIESDRVSEERRVWVKCEQCPPRVFLGEQAEVRILVARLDSALLVPEAAVSGYDGHVGRAWIVRNGRLETVELNFGHRTEDGRLQVIGGLPDDAQVVASTLPGFREGRRVRVPEDARQ
jgi:HlyD family secretion protein